METFIVLLAALFAAGPPSSYAELRHQGESFIAEKSFAKAHAAYEEASHLALQAGGERPPPPKRARRSRRWRAPTITTASTPTPTNLLATSSSSATAASTTPCTGTLRRSTGGPAATSCRPRASAIS